MSVHFATISGLVLMFIIATAMPINMGALGLMAAFIVGTLFVGMTAAQILAGFPGDLFVTLVGITYLFALAESNGTVDFLVHYGVKATGGRVGLLPWVMFAIGVLLTSIGAVSPGATAVLAPIAMRCGQKHGINPMLMGLMVIHGCQGGGFSQISVYGGITNQVVERAGLQGDEMLLFFASLASNLAVAFIIMFVFRKRTDTAGADGSDTGLDRADAAVLTPERAATLAALAGLALCVLVFSLNVGFVAVTAAVILGLIFPKTQKGAVEKAAWSTVLLICGVVTYVAVVQKAGTIDWIGDGAAHMGKPLLAMLMLSYAAGVVSAFASSVGVLGAIVPLAVPLLHQSALSVGGVVAAIAVSTTIVDASPFSTSGALVLANARPQDRDSMFKKLVLYGTIMTVIAPFMTWLFFVVL